MLKRNGNSKRVEGYAFRIPNKLFLTRNPQLVTRVYYEIGGR